ncbi:hypothetical protein LCGC14_1588270, partial [marine sediment metagenome]
ITHDRNFEFSKSRYFVPSMYGEIVQREIKIVRLHDTGDFYSQGYLDKWSCIARTLPNTRFYAYTKSLQLDFKAFTRLPNTKIIQSFGGKYDSRIDLRLPHARIFDSERELKGFDGGIQYKNYVDCSKSDLIALEVVSPRIGLIKHWIERGYNEKTYDKY